MDFKMYCACSTKVVFCVLIAFLFSSKSYSRLITVYDESPLSLYGGLGVQYGYLSEKSASDNNIVTVDTNLYLLYLFNLDLSNTIGTSFRLRTLYNSKYMGAKAYHCDSFGNSVDNIHNQGAYVFIKSKDIGIIEFGLADSVDRAIKISGAGMAVASGGSGGDWVNYVNLHGNKDFGNDTTQNIWNMFWVKPRLYNHYYAFRSPVINYYSKPIKGFKFGLTYVPGKNNNNYNDLVTAGVKYNNSHNDFGYAIAFVTEYAGENLQKSLKKIASFSTGVSFDYKNFKTAIAFGYLGEARRIPNDTSIADAKYLDIGMNYSVDNWKTSMTYFYSVKNDIQGDYKLSAWALGWENAFYKKMSYYVDLISFKMMYPKKPEGTSDYVFLSGFKLGF